MSSKQTTVPTSPEPAPPPTHNPTTSASQPPWESPNPSNRPGPDLSGEFTRLGEQIQDLKNMAYARMEPDHQTRLDAIMTTYGNMREHLRGRTF